MHYVVDQSWCSARVTLANDQKGEGFSPLTAARIPTVAGRLSASLSWMWGIITAPWMLQRPDRLTEHTGPEQRTWRRADKTNRAGEEEGEGDSERIEKSNFLGQLQFVFMHSFFFFMIYFTQGWGIRLSGSGPSPAFTDRGTEKGGVKKRERGGSLGRNEMSDSTCDESQNIYS